MEQEHGQKEHYFHRKDNKKQEIRQVTECQGSDQEQGLQFQEQFII